MICPDCGKELVEIPLALSEEELLNFQFAVDKMNVGRLTMSQNFLKGVTFKNRAEKTTFIKACLDEIAEGNFLYNIEVMNIRKRYEQELGKDSSELTNLSVQNGKLYKHKN